MEYTRAQWSEHYDGGSGFRALGDVEKRLLVERVPAPTGGGRALDVGCGTGELAVFLTSQGYGVDAVDFAEGALTRARAEHAEVGAVRWLCLDVEREDLGGLDEEYDLITMRLAVAFLRDRTRVLRRLAARLREDGALVVVTPVADRTPAERRNIALDEDELGLLAEGFEQVERFDAGRLAALVLRGAGRSFTPVEKRRPTPQAVFGAAMAVTDPAGRVLLGRSTRGMWELPAGRIETGESVPAAAVRELAEETGLLAREEDAHVLTILHDDRADVRRVTAVVRVTGWEGELGLPEPHAFLRWEWHDLHALAGIGPLFAPSAQALNAVWPGVLPGLPAVHSYGPAAGPPPVPGEPAEAVRLRERMADAVVAGGWAPSAAVRDALRAVPRHRFAPEAPLEAAYAEDRTVITARDDTGTAVSSVSAAWLQADMIEQLRPAPGATVFEAGSGGYNAELIAHVLGPRGRVITVDIDPYVVHRTQRLCAEAGSGRVTAVLGDGAAGAPGHVPAGGFGGMVITHKCWDVAPAWREQLAEGGRLVLPLEIGGYTRSIALERRGDVLSAAHWTYCGFVRDRGAAARTAPSLSLADGAVTIRWEDGAPRESPGLEAALRGPRAEVRTGVVLPGGQSYETLQLYAATTVPGFCRVAAAGTPLVAGASRYEDPAAIVADGSLAYLTVVRIGDGETPAQRRFEFVVHAYGEAGPGLAGRLARCVRDWDRYVRDTGYPAMTVHPAGTPDEDLPAGDVLDKQASRLVLRWPGRTPHTEPAGARALTAAGGAGA
ncbi:methyltransferase, FxLD system [Streptomyces sp. NPDC002574]|uniref:methyltransferase, FxLD system n=1 Tax=Streptomyces sp. NPDC002574 TaxID=3364652 RepID=UPI0036ACA73B